MTEQQPLIVVFPRGQLDAADKASMREVGVIAVEADDVGKVHQLQLVAPSLSTAISADGLLAAALEALASQPTETPGGTVTKAGLAQGAFVRLLAASVKANITRED